MKDDNIGTHARRAKTSLDLHNTAHVASRSRGRIPGNRRLFLGINPWGRARRQDGGPDEIRLRRYPLSSCLGHRREAAIS